MSPASSSAWTFPRWVLLPVIAVIVLFLALNLLMQLRPRRNILATPSATAVQPSATNTPGSQATATPLKLTYIVMPGDTLASIAEWLNVPPEAIMSANNLTSSGEIYPGQSLIIPQIPPVTATPTQAP